MTQEATSVPPQNMGSVVAASQGNVTTAVKQNTVKTSWYLPWIMAFIVWGIGVFVFFVLLSNDTWFAWRQVIARYIYRSEYVMLNNAMFDRNQYIVGKLKLNKPGFAVLYFGHQYDLGIRNPVAFTNLLLPGEYTNVQIKADDARIQAEDPALFQRGATLYVVLFHDDGNGIFNSMNPDEPRDTMAVDSFGSPVFAKLTIQ